MFTVFFSDARSVIIIYLSFLLLINNNSKTLPVSQLNGLSNIKIPCRKMDEDVTYASNTESRCHVISSLKKGLNFAFVRKC